MTGTAKISAPPVVPEKVIAPLCVIIFFSVLNGMMFNVAIPDIAREFSLLPSQVSWVMTGYILLFGLGSLFYGRLADHRSVRELVTTGENIRGLKWSTRPDSNWRLTSVHASRGHPFLLAAR